MVNTKDSIVNSVMQGTNNPETGSVNFDEISNEVDASLIQDDLDKRSRRITELVIERTGRENFYRLPLSEALALVNIKSPPPEAVDAYGKIIDEWEKHSFFQVMTDIYGDDDEGSGVEEIEDNQQNDDVEEIEDDNNNQEMEDE